MAVDHFRQELHYQMHLAVTWGAKAVVINARDLHSALGDFLGPNHQPKCCKVMEMIDGDVVMAESNKWVRELRGSGKCGRRHNNAPLCRAPPSLSFIQRCSL